MAPASRVLFRAVCADVRPRAPEHDDEYFLRGFAEARKFFDRFGGRLNVAGKRVLDVGCGYGSMCIEMAAAGASEVVGVDLDPHRIAYARAALADRYPHLADRVSFLLGGDLAEVGGARFDLVTSKDVFEHIADMPSYLASLRAHVADGGIVAAGFGPLWRSPHGGHISYMTRLPWAHLVFPETAIMAERRRFRPNEAATSFLDFVNKMTLGRFVSLMRGAGFEAVHLEANVSGSRLARAFRLLARLPLAGELFTVNVYSLWRVCTEA